MKSWLPLFILLCAVSGCVKPPSYPIEPQIEFKEITSNMVKSGYVDTIVISFTDGDGDIGVNTGGDDSCDYCSLKHGDSTCLSIPGFNIFLIDSRDTCLNAFASANIETSGKFDALSGDILIITAIDSKTCPNPPNPLCKIDSVVYSVILKDMAGHRSNLVKTSTIYVDPH